MLTAAFVLIFAVSAVSLLLGFFLYLRPVEAIDTQKKFYEKINWRMEPISLEKEIRNTKIMGFLLITVTFAVVAYAILGSYWP